MPESDEESAKSDVYEELIQAWVDEQISRSPALAKETWASILASLRPEERE